MSDGITKWLEELGLGKYVKVFAENDIDLEVVPHLTDADLEKLGLSLGHRRKLQGAVQALGETQPTPREARPPSTDADTPRAREAERRQLTVMFCDLAGSTELSQRLDAEDLREVNRAYQDACKAAIERYDGYVARYMGDGVLAYFGYPQAHEDDAERAIHAGLGVVEAMMILNNTVGDKQDIKLGVRVGIATGPVVVGDIIGEGASQESAVVGETPNLAARLQALATPNTVVVGSGTRQLAKGRFEYDDLGTQELKGIAEPVRAWRVIAPATAESRFEAAHRTGLTPLVGREHEIGLLLERWEQAKEGDGQVILLSGEAGIGKSRITETLRERTAGDDPVRLRYQCSPYHTNSALHPVIEQLERAAQFDAEDTSEAKFDKLESLLAQGASDVEAVAPLFAPLMSIPSKGRYAPLEMTAERQKEQTLEALVSQMEGLSQIRLVLLIFEDVHWADPTSLELLELIIERAQSLPALVVITFRPEFPPPWAGYTHVTTLTLNRFTRSLAAALVEKVTAGRPLPDEVLEQIIEKTDGVPLFVEELTKTILESGLLTEEPDKYVLSGPLSEVAIPATLHDSLMARLDRLGAVKEVAQTAAAIGRAFDYDLLAAVSPLSFAELHDALDQLIDAELVFRRGRPQEGGYIFKHALVQDAAYGSLLKSKRQELHGRVAGVLEKRFPERAETEPELLAHHLTEAGHPERAIVYWNQAGKRASEGSANHEAIAHLETALRLADELPRTEARDQQQLAALMTLGPALLATRGMATEQAVRVYQRARELSEEVGEPAQQFAVTWGQWILYLNRGQLEKARELTEQLLIIAGTQPNSESRLQAHHATSVTLVALDELLSARSHAEQALDVYDINEHRSQAFHFGGHDPGVCCACHLASVLWCLGFVDQALGRVYEAVKLAEELSHTFSLAHAQMFAARIHQFRREARLTKAHAEALITLCVKEGFAEVLAAGQILRGWAMASDGEPDTGIEAIRCALNEWHATGARVRHVYHLGLLADAYGQTTTPTQGMRTVEEAIAVVRETGERHWEAELYRLKGELLLLPTTRAMSEAQGCFHHAIELARERGAKSLELRAATSLARLWQHQGKRDDARDLLAPVHDWFTEGFDTADLKDAKTLLKQLS